MLLRVMNTRIAVLCCVLLLTAFSVSNSNAQNSRDRAQPIDWGNVLDLGPRNTETKPERLSLQKEMELGRQIREQNQRSQPDYPGRQNNRANNTGRVDSNARPQIEMPGVFERDRPDRSNDSDRQSSSQNERPQRGHVPQARPDLVGSPYYYNARRIDLYWNNPGVRDPYYGRAAKYYDRYVNQVAPTLSPAGRNFVSRVGPALQQMIDDAIRRDPAGFARLERDPVAFGRFMADAHTRAYYENGFANLPVLDKLKITRAIDARDLVDRDGRRTVRDLIPGFVGDTPPQYRRPAPRVYNPYTGRAWRR